jgi:hypothetical protein
MPEAHKIKKARNAPKTKKQPAGVAIANKKNEELKNGNSEDKRLKANDLKVGDWFSCIIYNQVLNVEENRLEVINQYGLKYGVTKSIAQNEGFSANQFDEEKKLTRTEIIEILESAGDTVFTVNFVTKATEDKAQELLSKLTAQDLADPAVLKALSKDIIQGHESTIVGHLRNSEPKMGRSSVIDLNLPKNNNIRFVDHRSINWLIFKRVKYVAK